MASLHPQIEEEKRLRNEEAYHRTRQKLREALHDLIPGHKVILFGSLTEITKFGRTSDVDIALEEEPPNISIYGLCSRLMEAVDRPVDVVLLSETRLRESILQKGETWIA